MSFLSRLLGRDQPTTGDRYPGHPIADRASRQRRAQHKTRGTRRAAAQGQVWEDADRLRERNRHRR